MKLAEFIVLFIIMFCTVTFPTAVALADRESSTSRPRKALLDHRDDELLDIPFARQDGGVMVRVILFLKKIIELVSIVRRYIDLYSARSVTRYVDAGVWRHSETRISQRLPQDTFEDTCRNCLYKVMTVNSKILFRRA